MALFDPIREKLVDTPTSDIDKHMRRIRESYKDGPTVLGNLGDIVKSVGRLIADVVRLPPKVVGTAIGAPLTVLSGGFSGIRYGIDQGRIITNTAEKTVDNGIQRVRDRFTGTL